MFSKLAVLALFVTSVIAGLLPEGVYRITNVASSSSARVYRPGSEIFVRSTKEDPGPFELWQLKGASDDGYIIRNIGLGEVSEADPFAAVMYPTPGEPVVTSRRATVFNIEPAGDGTFVIKAPYEDLLWNVEPPVIPAGTIKLRPAHGRDTERWYFSRL